MVRRRPARASSLRAAAAAAVAAVLAAAVWAPPAAAGCGQERAARPHHRTIGEGRAPLVLGDSTMFFSVPRLAASGIEADARVCRWFVTGSEMLAARRKAGTLPRLAILALGANGDVSDYNVGQALAAIGRGRVLGLVTPREPPDAAAAMRRAAARYPDQVLLIDWARHSATHPEWFGDDGLHVDLAGARAYADFIRRRADPLMPPPASRLRLPRSAAGAKPCGEIRPGGVPSRVFIIRGPARVTCTRARALAERSPLRPVSGWQGYAWRLVYGQSWSAVYRRADDRALVATRQAAASPRARPVRRANGRRVVFAIGKLH